MSILIKGMEMPKKGEYRMTLYVCDDGYAYMDVDLFPVDKDRFEATPVPPHGRLIDENELVKSIHDDWDDVIVWDESGVTTADEFERLVYEQPTIIEAEEGETALREGGNHETTD